MTNPLAKAAIQSGLIEQGALDEIRRWRPPLDLPETAPPAPADINEAAERIEQVLQEEGMITTRETDLEVLQQYLASQKSGILHIELVDDIADGLMPTRKTEFEVIYGRTRSNDYIFAYRGDTMAEEITNGLSYLQLDDETGKKIFFMHTREVFYGDVKAFMVCTPHLRPHVEQAEKRELPQGEKVSDG